MTYQADETIHGNKQMNDFECITESMYTESHRMAQLSPPNGTYNIFGKKNCDMQIVKKHHWHCPYLCSIVVDSWRQHAVPQVRSDETRGGQVSEDLCVGLA